MDYLSVISDDGHAGATINSTKGVIMGNHRGLKGALEGSLTRKAIRRYTKMLKIGKKALRYKGTEGRGNE